MRGNMKENMLEIKAAIVVFFSAMAEVLGWKGMLLILWCLAMMLDYATGSMAAKQAKKWRSNKAREGLWHKGGMIVVVMVCGMFDLVAWMVCANMDFGIDWPGIVLPMACCWYFFTECGSILENCEKMGTTVPKWLILLLKSSLSTVVKTMVKALGSTADPEMLESDNQKGGNKNV